jgi:small subunit ribosomal protein S6
MFLVGQNQSHDLAGIISHIEEIVARGHGTILAMKKWDERRLAYEIAGQKRGLYVLVYFKAPGAQLAHIERDCNLSEKLLRTLILRADHLSPEQIEAANAKAELLAEAKLRAERPQMAAPAEKPAESENPEAGENE